MKRAILLLTHKAWVPSSVFLRSPVLCLTQMDNLKLVNVSDCKGDKMNLPQSGAALLCLSQINIFLHGWGLCSYLHTNRHLVSTNRHLIQGRENAIGIAWHCPALLITGYMLLNQTFYLYSEPKFCYLYNE